MTSKKPGKPPDWQKLAKGLTEVLNRQTYDQRALWYGTEVKQWRNSWPFLSHDEDRFASTASETAWDRYFVDHLGGYPTSYKLFKDGVIDFYNVPEARPELFDTDYKP